MTDNYYNPAGTKGFSFLEYSSEDPAALRNLFTQLGLTHVANHKSQDIELWKQNKIVFLINNSESRRKFNERHGGGACGIGIQVENAKKSLQGCLERGGKIEEEQSWHKSEGIQAIQGIADTTLYLVDKDLLESGLFQIINSEKPQNSVGLNSIDHLTNNVFRGNMDKWADFYTRMFNFREIRYFDIEGKLTGLLSRALTSPCGKVRIPINESSDDKSQIEEFLNIFNGEGIQHIALETPDIYKTVQALRKNGVKFLDTPDTYYDKITSRLPSHKEPIELLRKERILIDGSG